MTTERGATFAFVDLAGFTAVTEAHGDREAVAILHAFRSRVEDALGADDELVKTIGDAVMLRFPTAVNAINALRELLSREITTPEAVLVPRAGAHHGCAVEVEGDYYGAAVNLAAHVAGSAKPGQLVVTGDVAAAAQQLGAVINHLGTPALRNVSDPIDLWDVRVGRACGHRDRRRLPDARLDHRRAHDHPRVERAFPPLLRPPLRRTLRRLAEHLRPAPDHRLSVARRVRAAAKPLHTDPFPCGSVSSWSSPAGASAERASAI